MIIVGFQNCSPVNFGAADDSAAFAKGTDDDSNGGQDPNDPNDPNNPNNPGDPNDPNDPDGPKVAEPPAPPEEEAHVLCENAREMYESSGITPGTYKEIRSIGNSHLSPFYAFTAEDARSVGNSTIVIVGAGDDALLQNARSVGNSRIVLCGINVNIAKAVGNSHIDIVGANVLVEGKSVGNSSIRIYTKSGVQIQ
jgi:hypothetical protein